MSIEEVSAEKLATTTTKPLDPITTAPLESVLKDGNKCRSRRDVA